MHVYLFEFKPNLVRELVLLEKWYQEATTKIDIDFLLWWLQMRGVRYFCGEGGCCFLRYKMERSYMGRAS